MPPFRGGVVARSLPRIRFFRIAIPVARWGRPSAVLRASRMPGPAFCSIVFPRISRLMIGSSGSSGSMSIPADGLPVTLSAPGAR